MELLKKLADVVAPSGNEEKVRSIIKDEVENYVDEAYIDNVGNLICRKKGSGNKVLLSANMDEIGFIAMVTDDKPFVRVKNIGDVKLNYLQNSMIEFTGGQRGILSCNDMENIEKSTKIDKFYVDMLSETGISTGDTAAFAPNYYKSEDFICSKALGGRVGCCILVNIILNMEKSNNDMYFVFTTQKELRNSGAKTAAYKIEPDYAVSVGAAACSDILGDNSGIKLGGGPAVKIIDTTSICHPTINSKMIDTAKYLDIKLQFEVSDKEKSDVGAIITSSNGIICGGLSIPCRYHHTPTEMVSLFDVQNATKLLTKICEDEFL